MKEGVDYHIKPMGKGFELSSMLIGGYVAGVVDLTKRGYRINFNTVTVIGCLFIANTIPKPIKKTKKKLKDPGKKPKIEPKKLTKSDKSKKNNQ